MPRPQNKQELFEVIQTERIKLTKSLDNLTDGQKLRQGACGGWSVKDILAHLVDLRSAL